MNSAVPLTGRKAGVCVGPGFNSLIKRRKPDAQSVDVQQSVSAGL